MQFILDWIAAHAALSGLIIFLVAAAESLVVVGVLVPGMAVMLGIGTLVGYGTLSLWPTLFWAAAGAIAGDGFSYWLGRFFDQRLRHVWPLTLHPQLILKGEQFFVRHGGLGILFGRFVGPLRAIVPAVAGMMHMPVSRFYFFNVVSALAWAPVVILPGAAFGASMQLASDVAVRLVVAILILALVVSLLLWLLHRGVDYVSQLTHIHFGGKKHKHMIAVYVAVLLLALVTNMAIKQPLRLDVPNNLEQSQWWQNQWQVIVDKNPPHTIQIYGDLLTIQQFFSHAGWYFPQTLKLENALRWLAPETKLKDLPLWQNSQYQSNKQLFVGFPVAENNSIYLISFDFFKLDAGKNEYLGLGRISHWRMQKEFWGIKFPDITTPTTLPTVILSELQTHSVFEVITKQHGKKTILLIRDKERSQGMN